MEFCTDSEITRTVFTQRKFSASFRESYLLPIFQIALDLICEAANNFKSLNFDDPLQTCLNYDFNGTADPTESASNDDASLGEKEYLSVVQLPASWKGLFSNPTVISNFFCIYSCFVPAISAAVSSLDLIVVNPCLCIALGCLSRVASIRRTLFSSMERSVFLRLLIEGVRTIMAEQAHSLNQIEPYHEFCRLLVRIKCNFQLSELRELEAYPDFIKLVTEFTLVSLQIGYQNSNANSLHYLLATWQRFVASMYLNPTDNELLSRGAARVSEAFINSVLSSIDKYSSSCSKITSSSGPITASRTSTSHKISEVDRSTEDDIDEQDDDCFLDDATLFTHQLAQFSVIGRCEYQKTCDLILEALERAGSNWQNLFHSLTQHTQQVTPELLRHISAEENKLSSLVYLIGALLTGRLHLDSSDLSTKLDSKLVCRVIQLMRLLESQLPLHTAPPSNSNSGPWACSNSANGSSLGPKFYLHAFSSTRLELAIMHFMLNFKRMFMTENVSRMSKVYRNLNDMVGIGSEEAAIEFFVRKILINLKFWSHNFTVLERTLSLFGDLTSAHNTLRRVKSLDFVEAMMQSHQPQHFPFLTLPNKPTYSGIPTASVHNGFGAQFDANFCGLPFSVQRYRARTQYFSIVTRVLSTDLGEDEEKFVRFMMPLTKQTNELVVLLFSLELNQSNGITHNLTMEEARLALIGLARDLRGLVSSLQTKTSYQMFVHWFYPTGFLLFDRALQMSSTIDCQLVVPVLKLLIEVVNNRNGRILFESTVSAGYYLIVEISKIIHTFRSISFPSDEQLLGGGRLYVMRLKPISCAMELLKTCLAGGYVNFGVLSLIRKGVLEELVSTSAELMLSLTTEQLKQYPKLAKSYFSLLEQLSRDHMTFLASLDPAILIRLFDTVLTGLLSTDSNICSTSCICADSMLSFMYELVKKERRMSAAPAFFHSNLGDAMIASNGIAPTDPKLRSLIQIPQNGTDLCNGTDHRNGSSNGLSHKLPQAGDSSHGDLENYDLLGGLTVWGDRTSTANISILSALRNPNSALVQTTQRMLAVLLSLVLYEECKSQWSISRPLFVLILIHNNLMEDVDNSLFVKNRDKFTHNLFAFRHSLSDFIKSSGGDGNATNEAEVNGLDSPENLEVISLSALLARAAGLKVTSAGQIGV
ncbi:hypothetical protein Ciccas_003350 [Cichlidogyrus casuarinus]|uniref:Uncharacterized protein n=1 Tax=Cichlidogyrus casuarinus TaxID=1844966 RepID=A0ABD2QF26_9PLAT